MARIAPTSVLATLALAVAVTGLTGRNARADENNARIARGKYLVTVAACHDCHTPWKVGPNGPEPDMSRMLSGHPESVGVLQTPKASPEPWAIQVSGSNTAWSGAWGMSFTANLTPDPETGIGKWTLRNFMDTIRSGRHLGRGRPVLPPMPIAQYRHMTDEDLAAVYAYLQSIPPIRNRVPEPQAPSVQTASVGPAK